jgi:hypothetical protein
MRSNSVKFAKAMGKRYTLDLVFYNNPYYFFFFSLLSSFHTMPDGIHDRKKWILWRADALHYCNYCRIVHLHYYFLSLSLSFSLSLSLSLSLTDMRFSQVGVHSLLLLRTQVLLIITTYGLPQLSSLLPSRALHALTYTHTHKTCTQFSFRRCTATSSSVLRCSSCVYVCVKCVCVYQVCVCSSCACVSKVCVCVCVCVAS